MGQDKENNLFNFDQPPPRRSEDEPTNPGGARAYEAPSSSQTGETASVPPVAEEPSDTARQDQGDYSRPPTFTPPPPVAPPGGPPPPPPPPSRANRAWLIAAVVLLVLCCCCLAFVWFMYRYGGDWILDQLGWTYLLPIFAGVLQAL